MAAKVFAVFEGVSDGQIGEVLASEGNDFALSDEAGKFILSSVGEGA